MIDKARTDFGYKIGAVIMCSMARDCAGVVNSLYREDGHKYRINKSAEAEKTNQLLIDTIYRDLSEKPGGRETIDEIVDENLNLIQDVLEMNDDQRRRVISLMKKMKKSEQATAT